MPYKTRPFREVALGLLVVLTIGCVAIPLAMAAAGIVSQLWVPPSVVIGGAPGGGADPESVFGWAWALASTIAISLVVGGVATALAVGPARVIALSDRWRRLAIAVVCVPLMMPTYLAYAGWNVLRQPGTWLGDVIARLNPSLITLIDQTLGVLGLAAWAWPLGVALLVPGVVRLDRDHADAMSLDGAGRLRRLSVTTWMLRGSLGASIGCIALVALGSSVPLHLAQVQTLAIRVWAMLGTQSPSEVWPRAWALLVMAVVGAWAITRAIRTMDERPRATVRSVVPSRLDGVLLLIALGLSVLAPMVLFAIGMRRWSSVPAFFRSDGATIWASLATGVWVGLAIAVLMIASHVVACGLVRAGAIGYGAGRVARVCLGAFCLTAIVPGVLIGSAVSTTIAQLGRVPELEWIANWLAEGGGLIVAHVARFGFVGIVVGWLLGRSEPSELRETRLLLGGSEARAWWLTSGRSTAILAAGVFVAGLAMSVQEIEATVILSPPGERGLAVAMLEQLHYNAQEQLMAAGLSISGVSLILALVVGGAAAWFDRVTGLFGMGLGRKSV